MNKKIEKVLADLIEDQKIPKQAVCVAAQMSEEQIDRYLTGEWDGLEDKDICYLNELSMLVGLGLNLVSTDERVKGMIESLISIYGFNINQLGELLNVNAESIQNMLAGKAVDINEKYTLAVASAYLFYALKKPGYQNHTNQ